jgi:hypothetical protein
MADLAHRRGTAGPARVAVLLERFDLVDAGRRPASTHLQGDT